METTQVGFGRRVTKKEDYRVSIDKELLQLVEPKVTITFLEGLPKNLV
jgi:hypothetical protein